MSHEDGSPRYYLGPSVSGNVSGPTPELRLPTCSTCKHWVERTRDVGVCDRISSATAHVDAFIDDGGPHDDDSGEWSTARLLTRSAFGCSLHTPAAPLTTEETPP